MQRALKLNLSSPIYLESTKLSLDGLISRSSSMEKGYEATVLFRIECDNESITLSQLGAGERNGYTEEEKQKWGQLIEKYLHGSSQLKAVFLLIDIRHDPSANDKMMYDWVVAQGYQPIIIATKLDKIKRSQIDKHLKMLRTGLGLVPGTRIIPFSAMTKQGRDEIWELVETEYLGKKEVE